MNTKIQMKIQNILDNIKKMDHDKLNKWKNDIYTNNLLIDNTCKECEVCTKYLFLIDEEIVKDNFLGITFLNNHNYKKLLY